ncbi:glycosyltransferase family 1 protein [uncultured Bacteroides sp.]|uniref:glycosyltransferase family 4 protein n=1 Tax=uncultured Bacteroides sp. TaxID=162156 RepID=UPI002AA66143|nr:glycosyltransferase family 1 protein [uncultured Bacteroides sp.]
MIKMIINVNLIGFSSNKSVGTLIYTKRLFSQLHECNNKDYHFIFYAQNSFDFSGFNLPKDAEIVRVPDMKSAMIRRLYEHTLFRLKLKKANFLFTPYMTIPLLFSPSKQIVTIHDMVPFMLNKKYGALKLRLLKFETMLAAKLSSMIVTVSNNSKKDICQITKVSPDKVHVIYNFIRDNEQVVQCLSDPNLIQRYQLSKPYFITVATLQPGKNIERLIRAFSHFLQENPGCQLCIVGNKGWGFATIYEEVQKLKMEESVIFTGYADDRTLDILYSHCLGVVYVSLYEGFGIPPLEGFYHHKAAIVSNNSSLPEVVGNAAIMVDPTDEISLAKGISAFLHQRETLESKIQQQILKFNPLSIANNFLRILKL